MTKKAARASRSPSSFGLRHSAFRARGAFTILELLVVLTIIIALAGLILATVGYVQKKGARSRAEAEIAALSAALESYKADNGIYPTSANTQVDPVAAPTPAAASQFLYEQLSGNSASNMQPVTGAKNYFTFKPGMLWGAKDGNGNLLSVSFIRDPFGDSYGYSTLKATNPAGAAGYNPTFDLWSTASANPVTDQGQWIKNW